MFSGVMEVSLCDTLPKRLRCTPYARIVRRACICAAMPGPFLRRWTRTSSVCARTCERVWVSPHRHSLRSFFVVCACALVDAVLTSGRTWVQAINKASGGSDSSAEGNEGGEGEKK